MNLTSFNVLPGGVALLTFDLAPTLTGDSATASKWAITGPTVVTVNQVYTTSGNVVVVRFTHPLQAGGSYALAIPNGIVGSGASPYLGPFTENFTGIGDAVTIVQAAPVDARVLQVVFNVKPDATALDPTNYVLTGGISIVSIVAVTDLVYRLTTSHQLIGTTYTLTAPGVVAGEPFYLTPPPGSPLTAYFGLATDGVYNAAFIQALPNTFTVASYQNTLEFLGGNGVKYAFVALPSSLGQPTSIFDAATWLKWPFTRVATSVNVSGVLYDLYRSDYVPTQSFTTHWF